MARIIIRFTLVFAGVACILDGMLNAYGKALGQHLEFVLIPIPNPFVRMAVGVILVALGLVLSGLLGRLAGLGEKPPLE